MKKQFNFRILISLINAYLFILLTLSGIILILYGKGLKALGIQMQVLNSSFVGLDSSQWHNIHIAVGLFFIVSSILHFIMHCQTFLAYLQGKSKIRVLRRAASIMAALLFISAAIPALVLYFDDTGRGGKQGGGVYQLSVVDSNEQYLPTTQGWGRQSLKKQSEAGKLDGSGQGWGHADGQGERKNYALWHTLSGLLLLAIGGWHFCYNWKPFMTYFTARSEGNRKFARELLTSAWLLIFILAGVLLELPFFAWLLSI